MVSFRHGGSAPFYSRRGLRGKGGSRALIPFLPLAVGKG